MATTLTGAAGHAELEQADAAGHGRARARELLEATTLPIEHVAAQAGFPSSAALRARFADDLDTTPTAYRRAFRGRT